MKTSSGQADLNMDIGKTNIHYLKHKKAFL